MPDEIEGKLIITGPDAPVVYYAIAGLSAVGGCRVAHRAVEEIMDAYFDSPERALFAAGLALRVRRLDGRELLTVKGESRVQDGVITREELEVEWSPEGLDDVLEALDQAGVVLGNSAGAREATTALQAVEALGLAATAPRSNRRVALMLVRDGAVVAELDVDAVTMTAGEHAVRHYEVECEARAAGDSGVVRGVLADLASRYPGLRPWSVSKLALGEALQVLAETAKLPTLLDGDRLLPSAYDELEAMCAESL